MRMDDFLKMFDFGKDRDGEFVMQLKKNQRPVYIYGAGDMASACLDFCRNNCIQPFGFFVDEQYRTSDSFCTLPCETTEILENRYSFDNAIDVVIGVANYSVRNTFLRKKFVKNVYCFANSYYFNTKQLSNDYFREHADDFNESYHLLDDKISRDIFIAYINSQINREADYLFPFGYKCLPDSRHLDAYFNNDIISLTEHTTFIDGGTYQGEDILRFVDYTKDKFTRVIGIEPDPDNFQVAQHRCTNVLRDKLTLLNIGVGDQPTELSFSNSNSQHSHFVDDYEGTTKVKIDTIDNILSKYGNTKKLGGTFF